MAIVFERLIGQDRSRSSVFIRLESEDENGLSNVLPQSVYIAEALSYGSPIVTVTFKDQYGVYMNLLKIDPSARFDLHIGETLETATVLPLRLSRIDMTNNVSGKSDNLSFKVSFVHYGWNEYLNKRRCRAWNNTKFSDIVEEIATESLYEEVEITPSRFDNEFTVQPHWTNNVFMRWVQENAIPEKYDDHYEFSGRIDNSFIFKSISDIIEENQEDAENENIPVIKLNGYSSSPSTRNEEKEENDETPPYFLSFSSTEHYMDSVINGGSFTSVYYDFDSGKLVTTPVATPDMKSLQMSDWSSNKEEHNTSSIVLNSGRDNHGVERTKVKMSSVQLSTNQFKIQTEGSIKLHVGHMVEVIVPTPSNMIPPFSVMYSGFYIVGGITHQLVLEPSPNIISSIELTRQGFDGVDLSGYTTTKLGKFVGEREQYEGRVYVQS